MIAIDIDMPKNCDECLLFGDQGVCLISNCFADYRKVPDDCPLIDIVECKDCIHSDYIPTGANCACKQYYGITGLYNFCGEGKRKE